MVIWENHGEDIQYKGTSTDALPVDVKITYYLNDKQVTADELKGQSGKVRIRFDYTNKYSQKVEVNGKTVEVSTPFVVCSASSCHRITSVILKCPTAKPWKWMTRTL